mmetsp:Transcript_14548/g.18838  ORF Transcript_14548/g.18838 Transcript_14548/m.18838 type:complete len:149 (-) Transcript_14548:529-975(-)
MGLAKHEPAGVYGWSYGGYLSLMCMLKNPKHFRVAVSGAPVTIWEGYDSHYTERYMGTPKDNADKYTESSVLHHVPKMDSRSKLMLVHGLIDENVHFRHTVKLISTLTSNRKNYDLVLFPRERHCVRNKKDRIYFEERILRYFLGHFK